MNQVTDKAVKYATGKVQDKLNPPEPRRRFNNNRYVNQRGQFRPPANRFNPHNNLENSAEAQDWDRLNDLINNM